MANDLFLISDTHFDHEVIRVHCGRPFTTCAEMNAAMVENWNGIVTKKDTVIIAGDFAWKRHGRWINALNGKKILVIGNHDHMSQETYNQFTQVIGTKKQPGILQRPVGPKNYIVVCHFPMWSWNASFHGSWHFYGHSHGRKREKLEPTGLFPQPTSENELPPPRLEEFADGLSCAVDVDVWDYTPVPWEVLKAKLTARTAAWEARKASWHQRPAGPDYPTLLGHENRKWRQHAG